MTEQALPKIDVTFSMESDAGGRDPDQWSPTLRRYHQLLWSKALPDGTAFTLDTETRHSYLHHTSARGSFFLASDSIVHSYRDAYRNRIGALVDSIPPQNVADVHQAGSTIGGYLLFPGDARGRKPTINGARGMHGSICDRIDLTLECIRRHYAKESSPLEQVLTRYGDFFDLYGDFEGYVDYWLLNDLVDSGTGEIRWYLPFDDFARSALPKTADEYETYRQAVLAFVRARNSRIASWVATASI